MPNDNTEPFSKLDKDNMKKVLDDSIKMQRELIKNNTELSDRKKKISIKSFEDSIKITKKILDKSRTLEEFEKNSKRSVKRIVALRNSRKIVGVAAASTIITAAIYSGIKKYKRRKEEESYKN